MTHRPLASLFFLAVALQLGIIAWCGPWALPLLWGAAAAGVAGCAYVAGRPGLLGKKSDGTFAAPIMLLLLPYMFVAVVAARARRWRGEGPWSEVAPGLFVGRRVQGEALPDGVDLVVDLTCEFPEPASVRRGRTYRCLPTLDGCASEPVAFRALAMEVAAWSGRVYVHCAVGHGRSAALAAAALLLRGLAPDVDAAEALMQRARPGIELKAAQRAVVVAASRRDPEGKGAPAPR